MNGNRSKYTFINADGSAAVWSEDVTVSARLLEAAPKLAVGVVGAALIALLALIQGFPEGIWLGAYPMFLVSVVAVPDMFRRNRRLYSQLADGRLTPAARAAKEYFEQSIEPKGNDSVKVRDNVVHGGEPLLLSDELRRDRVDRAMFATLIVCMVPVLYGGGLFALQIYLWLRSGVWSELPLVALAGVVPDDLPRELARWLPARRTFGELSDWLLAPSAWLGVHRLVQRPAFLLSLPATLMVLGYAAFFTVTVGTDGWYSGMKSRA